MKRTKLIMGMPITIEIVDQVDAKIFNKIFSYFKYVDKIFSTYKKTSQISQINAGKLDVQKASDDVKLILKLAAKTKIESDGFFDIYHDGVMDPSGIVKGWAILEASEMLKKDRFENFFIDAGGDIQTFGKNKDKEDWRIGIKNPFDQNQIIKVVNLSGRGIATSGTYIRGQHIYNPFSAKLLTEIVSMTIIGPDVLEADRFATAAFAMGKKGIEFVQRFPGLEGYMIDKNGLATLTDGFQKYEIN